MRLWDEPDGLQELELCLINVADEAAAAIFAERSSVLLAHDLTAINLSAGLAVDVGPRGCFRCRSHPQPHGRMPNYSKTDHNDIKARAAELYVTARFGQSGQFVCGAPIGERYGDALLTAIDVLEMVNHGTGRTNSDVYAAPSKIRWPPMMLPQCAVDVKYHIAAQVSARFEARLAGKRTLGGRTDQGTHHRKRLMRHARQRGLRPYSHLLEHARIHSDGQQHLLRATHTCNIRATKCIA